MFEPAHPAALPKAWQNLDVLVRRDSDESSFNAMDWDAVPKLDYASSQFRQLAIPEPARVIEDIHEFVMEDYGASTRQTEEALHVALEEPVPALDAPIETQGREDFQAELDAPTEEAPEPTDLHEIKSPVAVEEALDVPLLTSLEPEATIPEEPGPTALDTAALEQACEEAYQRGLADGKASAEQAAQVSLNDALAEAAATAERVQALALETQQQTLNEKIQTDLVLLREVTQKLEAWIENPKALFEPLKRLSVHLAEQMVLAELNVSGAAIERLVQRCLDELNLHGTQVVTVELNAQDKARLQELAGETLQTVQLQAVPGLQPGSVRVIANDTQVEDLVQHRLESLAHSLLGQPEAWREKSPFFRQPLAHRESEVQDIAQRPALPDTSSDEVRDA